MSSKLANFFKSDLDDVFLYQTNTCLQLTDRRVGICYRVCQLIVLIYFLLIAYFLDNGYQTSEVSDGITLLQNSGAGLSRVNHDEQGSWDSLDVTSAYLEGDNLFAATKMTQHFGQKIDKCVDFYRECKSDSDCISLLGEVCQENRCFGPNWCNSEGNTLTVEFDITDHYFLLFKSQVQFSELGRRKGFSDMSREDLVLYPKKGANTFTIGQILELADLTYREVREEGAIIKVNIFWNCYVGSKDCTPTVEAKRIDEFGDESYIGANEIKYTYYVDGDTTYRNVFNMTGVQLVFTTKAKGKLFSFESVVLQVATFLAFMKAIHYLFDFILTKLPDYKTFTQRKYTVVEKIPDEEEKYEDEEEEESRGGQREHRPLGDESDGLMDENEYSDDEEDGLEEIKRSKSDGDEEDKDQDNGSEDD